MTSDLPACSSVIRMPVDVHLGDAPHLIDRQRLEHHHLVDAVPELGREPLLQSRAGCRPARGWPHLARSEPERVLQPLEVLGADVRRHDHHRVGQIHPPAAAVGQPALVERLQEQVQQQRARLLDLVQQHHRARVVAQLVGEHAAALAADDAARHADQLVHRHARRPGTRTCRCGSSSCRRRTGTRPSPWPARSCRRRSGRGTAARRRAGRTRP